MFNIEYCAVEVYGYDELDLREGSLFIREGVGGIWDASIKNRMTSPPPPPPQLTKFFARPKEYTLTESSAASCSIGERHSHSSTSGEEELDDIEDEDEFQ